MVSRTPTPTNVSSKSRDEVERFAKQVLQDHQLYSLPVDPVLLANRQGIKVSNAKFLDDNLAGMIARRGAQSMILVDADDPPFRKRFTIAHELGHHFLHLAERDGEYIDNDRDLFRLGPPDSGATSARAEVQANWFAAALLMPAELVDAEFKANPDINALAKRFNVSRTAMGIRLEVLGLG